MTYIRLYNIYPCVRTFRVIIIIICWQTRRDAFIGSRWQLNGSQTENTIAAATFAHEYPHKLRWLRVRMRLWCPPPRSRNPVSDGGTVLTTTLDMSFIASATIYYSMVRRNVTPNCRSPSRIKVCAQSTAVLPPVRYDREVGTCDL